MIYKTLKKISDVCQLFIPGDTHTVAGVTITNNRDGSLTIDGTGTGSGTYTNFTTLGKNNMPYKISDKLFISAYIISGTCSFLFAGFSQSGNPSITLENPAEGTYYSGNISKQDKYESGDALGFFVGNNTFNNFRVKFNIINLTEMYGAGNEPTTVEQFRQDFPDEMYDYKPYCFVKSYKTLLKASDNKIITSYKKSLVCKTKNLFDNIPVKTNYIINSNGEEVASPGYNIYGKMYGNNFTISINAPVDLNGPDNWLRVCLYNSEGIFITRKDFDFNKRTVANIADDNTAYIQLCFHRMSFPNYKLQVEYGTTPTEYHPYGYL